MMNAFSGCRLMRVVHKCFVMPNQWSTLSSEALPCGAT